MQKQTNDALQKRIAKFVTNPIASASTTNHGDFCLATNIGSVRKQNQDRALLVLATYADAPEKNFTLSVVCDGVGGMLQGDAAAVTAISTFASRVLRSSKASAEERLRLAAAAANEVVYKEFQARGGTTLSAVFCRQGGQAVGLNVGDSRIYGVTNGRKLTQLSKDDTLAGYLGVSSHNDERRHQIVQYIGMGEGLESHLIPIFRQELVSILITTDGIHNSPLDALDQLVTSAQSNLDLMQKLISLSSAIGGRDNATGIVSPSQFSLEPQDQGLNLSFVSPFAKMEIWLPLHQEANQNESAASGLSDLTGEVPSSIRQSTAAAIQERRETRGNPKRNKKKRGNEANPSLPLNEAGAAPLEVEFPKKAGD